MNINIEDDKDENDSSGLSFDNLLMTCKKLYSNGYIDSEAFKSIIDKHGDKTKQVSWTKEREILLAEWAEASNCYKWLHDRASKHYEKHDNRYIYLSMIINRIIST